MVIDRKFLGPGIGLTAEIAVSITGEKEIIIIITEVTGPYYSS